MFGKAHEPHHETEHGRRHDRPYGHVERVEGPHAEGAQEAVGARKGNQCLADFKAGPGGEEIEAAADVALFQIGAYRHDDGSDDCYEEQKQSRLQRIFPTLSDAFPQSPGCVAARRKTVSNQHSQRCPKKRGSFTEPLSNH